MLHEKSNENSEYDTHTGTDSHSDKYLKNTTSGLDSGNGSEENDTTDLQTDKEGFIMLHPGQKFGSYEIKSVLGQGSYGRVLHVRNEITGQSEALKVGKNEKSKRETAMAEINTLTIISCRDRKNNSFCIKMLNWFNYNGHICIAFPVFGLSVIDFLRKNQYMPFAIKEVRHISYQLCSAVSFLHKNGMTHTDLKPENMLFVNSRYRTELNVKNKKIRRIICTDIRLIDFGNVTRDDDYRNSTITTTYYRAPEVTLKLGWGHPSDVWSIGCTLFEIYSGYLLFPADNDYEQLAMFENTLGAIPLRMTSASNKHFILNGKLNFKLNGKEEENVGYNKPLKEFKLSDCEDDTFLFDLIKRMLEYDPNNRITLKKVLLHSFFKKLPLSQRNRHKNSRN